MVLNPSDPNYDLNNIPFNDPTGLKPFEYGTSFLFRSPPGKSYTGEGSASTKKLEKPVWRPEGRQFNKFRVMLLTIMETKLHMISGA